MLSSSSTEKWAVAALGSNTLGESIGLTQLACLNRFHTKGGVRSTRVALHTQSTSFWLGAASALKHDNLALKRTWQPLTIQSLGCGNRKNNAAWIWNSRRDYLDWNWARMLLLILRKKEKKRKGKPSRKIKFKKGYKELLQDCKLYSIVSDLEGRICNNTAFPLHTMEWVHYWLMDRTAPYKLPATTSIDSGFGTRTNLNLWIEVNDNAFKETAWRKEVWQRNGKGHWKKWMGKGNKCKCGMQRSMRKFQYAWKEGGEGWKS